MSRQAPPMMIEGGKVFFDIRFLYIDYQDILVNGLGFCRFGRFKAVYISIEDAIALSGLLAGPHNEKLEKVHQNLSQLKTRFETYDDGYYYTSTDSVML